MARLTDIQLDVLRHRCTKAVQRGYALAKIDRHINALAEETGVKGVPKGTKKGTPAHLLELILEAKAKRSGKPRPKPAKAPKAKAPPKAKPAAPEVTTGDDEDVPPYDEWTKKELYDEAVEREIEGRSGMDKDELVAALEANDEEG